MNTPAILSFPDQLRAERARLGLSQAQCEAVLGVGSHQVAGWEQKRFLPHALKREMILLKLAAMPAKGAK